MNNKTIFSIINHKIKKRKNEFKNSKNAVFTEEIRYKKLNITKIDKNYDGLFKYAPDIYPAYKIYNNIDYLRVISNYVSQKINMQFERFRARKKITVVEFIAEDTIRSTTKNNNFDFDKYIRSEYTLDNLYNKELKVLPYLLIHSLLIKIVELNDRLNNILKDINCGSKMNKKCRNFSLAKIYGVLKYNENAAKILDISTLNYKKCVFNFFELLNKIEFLIGYYIEYIRRIIKKCRLKIT